MVIPFDRIEEPAHRERGEPALDDEIHVVVEGPPIHGKRGDHGGRCARDGVVQQDRDERHRGRV
jgi:hypothetical protein